MKTTSRTLSKSILFAFALISISLTALADGGASEVFTSGTTHTAAGDFVVTDTDDVYHYQGDVYKVYNVYYDNPGYNMKIAVTDEDNCESFIAYTNGYWFHYNCTKEGFGVRKAMFTSALVRDTFDANEYHDQTVLVKTRKIEKDQAVGLIAAYLPKLQG